MVRGLKTGPLKYVIYLQSAEADIVCVVAVSTAVLSPYSRHLTEQPIASVLEGSTGSSLSNLSIALRR